MLEESGRPKIRSSRFTPGEETRYPSYKSLGGHRGRYGKTWKISVYLSSNPGSSTRSESLYRLLYPSSLLRSQRHQWHVTVWLLKGRWQLAHFNRLQAVWCLRELLLGSVPQSSPLSTLRPIYRRSVQRANQTPSCQTYVQKTTGCTRTSLCHADTADVITVWRYIPTLKAKTNLCFYAEVHCNYIIFVWKQTGDFYTKQFLSHIDSIF